MFSWVVKTTEMALSFLRMHNSEGGFQVSACNTAWERTHGPLRDLRLASLEGCNAHRDQRPS